MARIRRIATVLSLAAAAILVVLAVSPLASTASADACARHGNKSPTELTRKQARKAVLCLINAERRSAGVRSLHRDRRLQKAAQRHNNRMVGSGCFAHECPGEGGLGERLEAVGYLLGGLTRWVYGENVAWGLRDRGTPSAMVAAWMDSPGHRSNILNRSFRDIGVGFSVGSPSGAADPGGIYTTDFGLRVR